MDDVNSDNAHDQVEWSADELIPFGKYILLDRVSSGATAAVYRANVRGEAGFERLVAIKRILPHMAGDRDFVDTFVREAKTVAKLAHEGICPIYELGKVGESLYMAIEYIQGRDLGRVTRRLGARGESMPPVVAAWIAARLCDALDYAHTLKNARGNRTGIIHRDISPANIMLSYEGQVRLLDFGLAKAVGRAQSTNVDALKAKIGYMSPEMVKGRALDARSDLFGVGVCLYETLTGRRLFAGQNDIETIGLVSKAVVPPPSAVMEDAPEELEAVILKALAREPDDRYQTAAEMSEALNACIQATDPSFGSKDLAKFLHSLFVQDIEAEQRRIKTLLAASSNPELIKARRVFFASATGAAARARAELERQASSERPGGRLSSRVAAPTATPVPVLLNAGAVGAERPGGFEDEPTAYYDADRTQAAPPGLIEALTGFEDEPTQYLGEHELQEIELPPVLDSGGFDEEPTEIFFNKEEGQGMQWLHDELDAAESMRAPLNKPIISPELQVVSSRPPRPVATSYAPRAAAATEQVQLAERAWEHPMPSSPAGSVPPASRRRVAWAVGAGAIAALLAIGLLVVLTPLGVTLGLRAAPTGVIELRTNPAVPANVKLDGVFRGVAPLRMQGVRIGTRSLSIRAQGYLPLSKRIMIEADATTMLELALTPAIPAAPAPAPAPVVPAPPAEPLPAAAIPAAPTPRAPAAAASTDLVAGQKRHMHEPRHTDRGGVVTTTSLLLPQQPQGQAVLPGTAGTLSINTVPWSYVYIDGRDTGRNTPLLSYPLAPGNHEIRLQTSTGAMYSERVQVMPGQAVRVSHRF